jgi:hypothetical protein
MLGISKEYWVDMADAQDDIVVKELHIPKVRKYTLRCVLKMFFTRRTCLILERK